MQDGENAQAACQWEMLLVASQCERALEQAFCHLFVYAFRMACYIKRNFPAEKRQGKEKQASIMATDSQDGRLCDLIFISSDAQQQLAVSGQMNYGK